MDKSSSVSPLPSFPTHHTPTQVWWSKALRWLPAVPVMGTHMQTTHNWFEKRLNNERAK